MSSENASPDALGLVGTTIAEKYVIESVVGQGGFATVYRATHVLWKRPVAVKVFTALGEVAREQRQRLLDDFIREGALLADLSERSTAICQARDVGMFTSAAGETVPYMVLEWLDGLTLESLLEAERAGGVPPRTFERAIRLLEPVAEALALAHKKGIAHRDVKPANVFVLRPELEEAHTGQVSGPAAVKLLDFGIAKVVQDAQRMGFGKTAGHITSFTPLYGAPEQFNRSVGATGPWTDVFALALVIAEVVSGQEPMAGDNLVQLAFASSDPSRRPTPRALGVAVPDALESVFLKAVAVRPEDRFQTVGDFWAALRGAAFGDMASSSRSSFGGNQPTTTPVNAGSGTIQAAPAAGGAPLVYAATALPAGPGGPAAPYPYGTTAAPTPAASPGYGSPGATSVSSDGSGPVASVPYGSVGGVPPAPRSKTPLVAGLAVAIVIAGIGAFALKSSTGKVTDPKLVGSSSSAPSAPKTAVSNAPSALPPASSESCPSGMIHVPGGDFFMGSDEKDAQDTEMPAHKVRLSAYCLDEFEVTVAQYKECSDKGSCRRAGKENVWDGITPVQRKIYDPLCNINDAVAKASHPINCVDWEQAREYCDARGGRLPTEAEWEFAARGPDGRIYPWGDEAPNAQHLNACGKECIAWFKAYPSERPAAGMYAEDDGFVNTAPVGSFPKGKSRYGVQDVVGNVWEWVADWHASYAGATPGELDPKGPSKGTTRVIRGGAWNGVQPSWVRPSFRYSAPPTMRSYGFGFRCAQSPGR